MSGVVELSRCCIVAIEISHFEVAAGHLFHQFAIEGIPIEVLVTRAVGQVAEMAFVELQRTVGCLADVLVVGLAYGQFSLGRTWK